MFKDNLAFLSNMYPRALTTNKTIATCSESAYQSFKTTDPGLRVHICSMTGYQSKKFVHRSDFVVRDDWKDISIQVMTGVVKNKFMQNPDLLQMLHRVDDSLLVEYNYWHDCWFGHCTCLKCKDKVKHDNLGLILRNLKHSTL